MIFRIGLTEEMYFKEYFGNFPWEWQLRIEYLDFIFSVPAAFYFIGTLYKEEFKKAIGYLVLGICILNALIVIFTDTLLFTQTLIYFQVFIFVTSLTGIFMIIRAIINKREGAIIFLLGFLILVATIINDILYNNNLSNFAGLYPVGFFIFIFFQAFLLSKIFSRALSTVETLSADLEAQVVERTKELTVEKEIALNALQAKSQFLSVMSHEIRTPLNGVIGIAQVFSNENLSAQQKDLLSKLKFSAETLLLLINDVLDFSKIEEGKIEFEKVAFNLKGLLENISGIFSSKIEEKKNALLIDISPQIPEMLIGDSHRLSQILINLIGNSAKFTSSGKIIVSAIVESSTSETVQIRFEVSDTGIGIEYSDKEKIFEKFTQANLQVSRNFGGTGLGLAIVKRLLELQGSRIDFTSEPGKGSKFFFVLQFDTKIGSGESIDKSVQNESRGIDLKGLIILVVDDNDINILLAKRLLEKAGIVVESALNGESAIEKFRAGKFDFVLMDVHMPGMDGFETTVEIRKIMQERNEDVPVIALSADITPEVKRDAEKSGMKDYLTKPFEQKALYAKIEQYLMKK